MCERKKATELYEESRDNKKFHTVVYPLTDKCGNVEMLGVYARDITEIMDAKEQLEDMNNTKNTLLSIIALDLRSPFNVILGFSELLLKQGGQMDENKRRTVLEGLYKTSKNSFRLVENLLSWARSQSRLLEPNFRETNLRVFFKEFFDNLQPEAEKKGIELKQKVEGNLSLKTDPDMLNTIMRNLVTNAMKFTESGGIVSAEAYRTANDYTITIKDTGCGIREHKIDKLFEIQKGKSTRGTDNETGTGFGLVLSKEFTEKLGGTISVSSTVGEGSEFSLRFPAE